VRKLDDTLLCSYEGVYQWEQDHSLYLQIWSELAGTNQLVAFDESGEVRTLYATEPDRFFAGPGAAVSTAIESRVEFQRDGNRKIVSLTWKREGADPRTARRVEIEKHEDSASRVATFTWPVRSSARRRTGDIRRSS
jgi:hypothetical protein